MTSTDSLRAEADAIGRRHPHINGTCPPHAAALHRLAALITENDLPAASVTVTAGGKGVFVSATHTDLPENVVRRWAQAVDAIVTASPAESSDGTAATLLLAEQTRDTVYFHISAILPVPAVTA